MTERTTAAIKLLRNHSLPSLVQSQLEVLILNGRLPPGSQLTEVSLAGQMGISRGPLREAFRGLEEKGLVRVEKNRGAFVRTISPEEGDQIYEVRLAMEELIMKKLVANPGVLREAKLGELLDKADNLACKGDFGGCHQCNIAFHDRLALATGNATLLDNYRRLVGELSLFRHQGHARIADASSLRASVADHREILTAVSAGDAKTAIRLIRNHLEASRKRLHGLLAASDPTTK
jgi:DNA-binding GntR family transcriptional regulator